MAGLLEKKSETRVDESDFAKKIHRGKDKVKKVKSEAMRMTMELGDESRESKELKKLKKSLIKKTDKVVKVAMKIEKKNHQETRARKNSLSSSNTAEQLQVLKVSDKKDKKSCKAKDEKKIKVKKSKDRKEDDYPEAEVNYPVSLVQTYPVTPTRTYPLIPVVTYPLVVSPTHRSVVTCQPRGSASLPDQPVARQQVEVPRQGEASLPAAVFLSVTNQLARVAQSGEKMVTKVSMINMGCLAWDGEATVQRAFSSEGLLCPASSLSLPPLEPGQEGSLDFPFTAPSLPGQHESVWHFWLGTQRFGPALKFKIEVKDTKPTTIPLMDTELKDYTGLGQEMKALGASALQQEMVVMTGGRARQEEGGTSSEEDFDLLAGEVDSLTLETGDSEEEFEVIPVPDCFNLEVPFELVDSAGEGEEEEEEESEEETSTLEESKTPLEEAVVAVKIVQVTILNLTV